MSRTDANPYPYNLHAERALLACILQNPFVLDEVASMLAPDDFYAESHHHASIYAAMLSLYNRAEQITVTAVEREIHTHDDTVFYYLMRLMESVNLEGEVVLFSNAAQQAHIIASDSKRRKVMHAGEVTVQDAYADTDADAVLERAQARLQAIDDSGHETDWQSLADIGADYAETFATLSQHKGGVHGVPTGFHALDYFLGGLQPGDMDVVAGRPGTGKTSFALSVAYNAAFQYGKRVAFFSLEMSRQELFGRLVSMHAHVDGKKLRTPWELDSEQRKRVNTAIMELESGPILIDDTSAISTTDLRSKARRARARHGQIDLIIIDYLQLMVARTDDGKRIFKRQEEIAEVSRAIKALAKEMQVPVLALAQLNREVESSNSKIPQLSHLRESGQIEQDADTVLFTYCEEMHNPNTERKGQVDIIIAKHRNGPTGEAALHFAPQFTQFSNLEVRMVP